MSKLNKIVAKAYEKGYRVKSDGSVQGLTKDTLCLKVSKRQFKYYNFSACIEGNRENIGVHKLAAYQKYKEALFEKDIEVRHLDNDSLNNKPSNIAIGTKSDNAQDKLPEVRKSAAIKASNNIRKFSDDEMENIRRYYNECRSYKHTMEYFDIGSKGTLHYILNTKYQTKK